MTTPTPLPDPAILVFTTETGSVYRVDFTARTIERLSGAGQSTARVGEGTRRYESIALAVGSPCVISWGEHTAIKAVEGAAPVTVTSPVRSIEP